MPDHSSREEISPHIQPKLPPALPPILSLVMFGTQVSHTTARGLQTTGDGDVYLLTLFLPTPLDQLCTEHFPKVPSLGPKLWGKKIKGTQEKCKQLLQSQQRVLAPELMDLFSSEGLEWKEEDQCFRKSTLPQLDLWSIADPKQAPDLFAISGHFQCLLSLRQKQQCLEECPVLHSPKFLPSSSSKECHREHHHGSCVLPRGGKEGSPPASQKSAKSPRSSAWPAPPQHCSVWPPAEDRVTISPRSPLKLLPEAISLFIILIRNNIKELQRTAQQFCCSSHHNPSSHSISITPVLPSVSSQCKKSFVQPLLCPGTAPNSLDTKHWLKIQLALDQVQVKPQ